MTRLSGDRLDDINSIPGRACGFVVHFTSRLAAGSSHLLMKDVQDFFFPWGGLGEWGKRTGPKIIIKFPLNSSSEVYLYIPVLPPYAFATRSWNSANLRVFSHRPS